MKRKRAGQGSYPVPRGDRLIQERDHDPYKNRRKPREPTACPDCGAVFRDGRWRWATAPADALQSPCPACQRIRDGYPAGYVTLAGDFLHAHRDEILRLARNVESREKQQHVLKRIMDVHDEDVGIVIATTELQLARAIGTAIHAAYQGDLSFEYSEDGSLLRVTWTR